MPTLAQRNPAAVPAWTARLYAEAADHLASEVSHRLSHHPRIGEFLNGNSFRLLQVEHRNHAAFMAEVLRAKDVELLGLTLRWTYHAYHHQGIPYDYFQAQFEIWKEVISEHLPEAAASLAPIYDHMLAIHPETLLAADLYRADAPGVAPELQAAFGRILAALIGGDHLRALEECHVLLDTGTSFQRLLQTIFFPAMVEVGTRWEGGRLSVGMEHQTTSTVYLVLSTLYYEQPLPAEPRGRALVASVSNEFHELGAWMLASCLELDGWEVDFLASDCDQDTLLAKAREGSAHIIALSVSLLSNLQAARETIAALRAGLDDDTRILVGGRALNSNPSLADSLGADLFLSNCESAVIWARDLWHSHVASRRPT